MNRLQQMEQTEYELRTLVDDLQRVMRANNDTVKNIKRRMEKLDDQTAKNVHAQIDDCWNDLDDVCEDLLSLLDNVECDNDPTPLHAEVE